MYSLYDDCFRITVYLGEHVHVDQRYIENVTTTTHTYKGKITLGPLPLWVLCYRFYQEKCTRQVGQNAIKKRTGGLSLKQ